MKKILSLLLFSLSAACAMQAQDFSMMQKYRTGKMNAAQSQQVQRAMWDMAN